LINLKAIPNGSICDHHKTIFFYDNIGHTVAEKGNSELDKANNFMVKMNLNLKKGD
jgi:hypothetical protein